MRGTRLERGCKRQHPDRARPDWAARHPDACRSTGHDPRGVYEEVVVKGVGKPGADEMRDAPWIETHEVAETYEAASGLGGCSPIA